MVNIFFSFYIKKKYCWVIGYVKYETPFTEYHIIKAYYLELVIQTKTIFFFFFN